MAEFKGKKLLVIAVCIAAVSVLSVGYGSSLTQSVGTDSTPSSVVDPAQAKGLPPVDANESLEQTRAAIEQNTNVRDGALGSLCWATREMSRGVQGQQLSDVLGKAGISPDLVPLLEAARYELSKTSVSDTSSKVYQTELSLFLDEALRYLNSGETVAVSTLSKEGGPLDMNKLTRFERFYKQAPESPNCSML